MKLSNISAVDFNARAKFAKNRFLPQETKENLQLLLDKMNSKCVYNVNEAETSFVSTNMIALRLNNQDTFFYDERCLVAPKKMNSYVGSGLCGIKVRKTELTINGRTGEVYKYTKGLFTTWEKVFKTVGETINTMLKSFDDSNVVTQRFITVQGFTKKGVESLLNSTQK